MSGDVAPGGETGLDGDAASRGDDAPAELVGRLEEHARGLGFTLFGVTSADPTAHMGFYRRWVSEGMHGEMAYLARADSLARRADLRATMASVSSVIVVGHGYGDADAAGTRPGHALIARYARGEDYHAVVKAKLAELHRFLEGAVGRRVGARPYVDTGPILERDLARRAGLGWFGRNTMLIDPESGSYFFLGLLLVDVELSPSEPFDVDRCGTCRACLDACPTGALLGRDESGAPVIDARRCISYLTIELRGPIPEELRAGIGNRVFGCDICQEVCPWNVRFAKPTREEAYAPRAGLDGAPLVDLGRRLLGMTDEAFRDAFRRSPVLRARREGLLRNVCVALGNWGAKEARPILSQALRDPSPLVREHAAWALERIEGGTSDVPTS